MSIEQSWDVVLEEAELGLVPEGFRDKLKAVLLTLLDDVDEALLNYPATGLPALRTRIKELP